MKTRFLLFLGWVICSTLNAQVFLNLDFEFPTPDQSGPKNWFAGGEGYMAEIDETVVNSGKYSLSLHSLDTNPENFGVCTSNFPIDAVKGKSIEFKGFIKTRDLQNGYAGLWWRIDGENKMLGFDNMNKRGLTGTQEWTEVAIKMAVPEEARNINFGCILTGKGKAWFDGLEVWIDGTKYQERIPNFSKPTLQQLTWLKSKIIPLNTCDPAQGSDEDFTSLKEIFQNVRIVGLGESTHGSREIFQMKHRLIRHLVRHLGFDIFSIEANMPESYKVNEYTQGGKGSPEQLLKGMYFWTWQTEEVKALLDWMQENNQQKDLQAVQFTGFDMQFYQGSIQVLQEAFAPDISKALSELVSKLEEIRQERQASKGYSKLSSKDEKYLKKQISALREEIDNLSISPKEKAWVSQNLKVIEQSTHSGFRTRDAFMAENVTWIASQNPDSKMVLWAHNGHVEKTPSKMGGHLHKVFGKDYYSIGFAFHTGNFTAYDRELGRLTTCTAQDSYPGTFEYILNAIDEPIFFIDLRSIPKDDPEALWLFELMEFRQVGAVNMDNQFRDAEITKEFDGLIFIRDTSPTRLLLPE